jgi:hypothetical protein
MPLQHRSPHPGNDNQGPDGGRDEPDRDTRQQVDRVALTIARLLGRFVRPNVRAFQF